MQRETLTALQRAERASTWTPEQSILDDDDRTYRTLRQRQLLTVMPWSETRLIVDKSGRLIRRGDKMPTTEVTTEVDLRIPTYIRRGIGGEK